jgi:DNA replication protein DnaC
MDPQKDYATAYAPIIRTTLNLARHNLVKLVLKADQHLFSMMYACMAPAMSLSKSLETRLHSQAQVRAKDNEATRKLFKDLQREVGVDITSHYTMLYITGTIVHDMIVYDDSSLYDELLKEWATQLDHAEGSEYVSALDVNLRRLSTVLELRPTEIDILRFVTLKHEITFNVFYSMLLRMCSKSLRNTSAASPLSLLRIMFTERTEEELSLALSPASTLIRSGLAVYNKRDGRLGEIEPYIHDALVKNYNEHEFFNLFITPLEKKETASSIARFSDADINVIESILDNSHFTVGEEPDGELNDHRQNLGFNVLCYGPKSVDKRNLLVELLEKNAAKPWLAKTTGRGVHSAPSICYIAQRWLAKNEPDAVLIVENAQDVLKRNKAGGFFNLFGLDDDDSFEDTDSGQTREELDEHVLLDNPVVSFWLVGNPQRLTNENLGRFMYHCEVKAASRKSRREGIEKEIARLGLDPATAHDLSKYMELSEQQVKSAVKLASLIADHHTEQKEIITSAIDRSQRAFGRSTTEELRTTVTKYSTDLLNLSGQFSVSQIINSFRKRPQGSACFYGIPGTGKTQLAEHMAVELDLPIIKKRGSDLLSKWVGENEANIASMFQEAADENAILLLDEADSFLRDRALARSGWEVTMVNELLQQMERFNGIFICATNLFEQLDAASLRRFTFKLEFKELTSPQKWKMFLNETELNEGDYNTEQLEELEASVIEIANLTPGDFATVKRQMILLDGTLTPDQWIEQLAIEAKTKLAGLSRNKIGFAT